MTNTTKFGRVTEAPYSGNGYTCVVKCDDGSVEHLRGISRPAEVVAGDRVRLSWQRNAGCGLWVGSRENT